MKQLSMKKKTALGPYLSILGFVTGIICLILSIFANYNVGTSVGGFSLIFGLLGLIFYSNLTQRVYIFEIEEYECVNMDNFYLIVFCDKVRQNHLVVTFFTKQAYEVINKGEKFILKMEFNYFTSNTNPDLIIAIIGEEEVYATSLKTWNPKT